MIPADLEAAIVAVLRHAFVADPARFTPLATIARFYGIDPETARRVILKANFKLAAGGHAIQAMPRVDDALSKRNPRDPGAMAGLVGPNPRKP